MYAVIEFSGHQYLLQQGEKFVVDRLEAEEGEKVVVGEVLMVFDAEGKDIKIGQPYVEGAKVELKVLTHRKGTKVRVFKMKPKKRYMRNKGHRQHETVCEVVKIG